jgi:hypothetical protein
MKLATIDELTVLAERIIAETEDLPQEQKRKKVIDEVYEILVIAYILGVDRVQTQDIENRPYTASESAEPQQTENVPYDTESLYNALYRSVGGQTFEQRITERIQDGTLDKETLKRILETDYHRMEETGAYDRAMAYAKETGQTPYKVWRTMHDERVRDQHWWSEGQTVPIDGLFTMPDGSQAPYPGMFGIPDQDCNCRCWVAYTFR